MGKIDSLFNKWCWENWASPYRRMKLDHSLTPYTEINKMDERPQCETGIHLLEKNIGSNLFNIGRSNVFQDTSPKARETKAKMNF